MNTHKLILICLIFTSCGKALDAVPQQEFDDPVFTGEIELKVSASNPSFEAGLGGSGRVAIPTSLWIFDGSVSGATVALTLHDTKYCYMDDGGELILQYTVALGSSCALGVQGVPSNSQELFYGELVRLQVEDGSISGRVFTWLKLFE